MKKNDFDKTIDWYINESKNLSNASMSLTRAFSFDDDGVVLVEYSINRPNIEEISQRLKALKAGGVNTPLYLAYKKDYDKGICYVLQEKAKGKVFSEITRGHDLEYAANIPVEHYAKFIRDVIKMHGLGIELRPRNYFYDENIGFTIIDIDGIYDSTYDKDSLRDVWYEFKHIYGGLNVNVGNNLSEEEEKKSKILNAKRKAKILLAFEQSLPGFKENKRWMLREISGFADFELLNKIGYEIPDLTLNEEEKSLFNKFVEAEIDAEITEIMFDKDDGMSEHYNKALNVLNASIPFFSDYKYKDFTEHWDTIFLLKLKKAYIENRDNIYIEEKLIEKIMRKIDPVRKYNEDVLYDFVKMNLNKYLTDDFDAMFLAGNKKHG